METKTDLSKVLVFCVVPTFNLEKSICRAVISVLRQKEVPIRVIIVDHGSTDGTADLIKAKFGNEKRVFFTRINRVENEIKSASRPLNVGFQEALLQDILPGTKRWLMRLDADDFLYSDDILQRLLIGSDFKTFITAQLAFFNTGEQTVFIYGPGKKYNTRKGLLSGGSYAAAHHSTLMGGELLQKLYKQRDYFYDEAIGYGEDLELTMSLLRSIDDCEFKFIQLPVIFKFIGDGTISTTTKSFSILNDMVKVFKRFPELPRKLLFKLSIDLILRNKGDFTERIRQIWGYPAKQVGFFQRIKYEVVQDRFDELGRSLRNLT